MALLKILIFPDQRLRTVAEDVLEIDDEVIKLMGKHKSKLGGEKSVPINLQYFLNMRLQKGGGGKEVILNNKAI